MNNEKNIEVYEKISKNVGNNVVINPELCFYSPTEVKKGLLENTNIIKWLNFISNHYKPSRKDILLLYPCSTVKPYSASRSYKILNRTLRSLDTSRERIQVMTISEPFGLVPEEYYGVKTEWHDWENDWYDCPGLFEWWCNKYGFHYDQTEADKSIEILSDYVGDFFRKADRMEIYKQKIALLRTFTSKLQKKRDHTHRRIIEMAAQKSETDITMLPRKDLIEDIVNKKGAFAWDMWGVAHPLIQESLKEELNDYLSKGK